MRSVPRSVALATVLAVVVLAVAPTVVVVAAPTSTPIPANVDVSQRSGNESEEAIAVNPTNPDNIVVFTNIAEGTAGMFLAVSFDGGQTWSRRIVGEGTDLFGDSCCDPSAAFDRYGNLFVSWLYNTDKAVPIALSTDGGLTFSLVAQIAKPAKVTGTGDRQGTFRFTDQETVVTGPDGTGDSQVWIVFNSGGPMVATGARVTGLGRVGSFAPYEIVPNTNNCTYGDVAIGPNGQVMNVCTQTESGQGGGTIRVNVDPDGLGPAGFGGGISVTDTHVGGFDFIPAQPDRSIDAEPGLAWDRTGGPHNGRVYLVYTYEVKNESDNTDIRVQYSDDNGATWSDPVRVNDDATANSQFLPKISLDPTSGHIAVTWYDARNDLGTGGAGDTDGVPNDDAQIYGAFSSDGSSFTPNMRISAGTSNSHDANNGIDFGDYSGLAFYGGVAHPAWSDNSNSTGTNPDGALGKLDIYTASVQDPQ